MPKRSDYISWDAYFMGVALLSAKRSKDPCTQVGACIVNAKNRIMSMGYNGFPIGISDDEFPWESSAEDHCDSKYPYVCHAELNAILNNGGGNLDGCKIYVALFPCCECAKAIIQCGIREVLYLSDKYAAQADFRASRRMFAAAGVKLTQLCFDEEEITLDFRADRV
ncbi:MAG: dCMP deaminase family protein [Oscillospiraceae bacterium]|jgi:dCMP deaminase|nr:dCMP deaminase family protein [Oscillospiraceae bacterium]